MSRARHCYSATNGDGQVWADEFSWTAIKASMQVVSEALRETVLLFYSPPQSAGCIAILTERAFLQTDHRGTFELRTAIPTPTKERQQLASPEGEGAGKVSQRLSFDSFQTTSSNASLMQAQLKYEREVRKTLTSELEKRFPVAIPSQSLEARPRWCD